VASGAIAVAIAVLVFDVPFPPAPLWFLVAFVLATASIFAIGLLVGARVRSPASAAAIGMAIYFPLLFLGGLWVPLEVMPDGLRAVSDLSPLGAAVQALDDAWQGITPSAQSLIVMVAWALGAGALAVRFFRWE
jgi:ABC-2 type transport system permease protein